MCVTFFLLLKISAFWQVIFCLESQLDSCIKINTCESFTSIELFYIICRLIHYYRYKELYNVYIPWIRMLPNAITITNIKFGMIIFRLGNKKTFEKTESVVCGMLIYIYIFCVKSCAKNTHKNHPIIFTVISNVVFRYFLFFAIHSVVFLHIFQIRNKGKQEVLFCRN